MAGDECSQSRCLEELGRGPRSVLTEQGSALHPGACQRVNSWSLTSSLLAGDRDPVLRGLLPQAPRWQLRVGGGPGAGERVRWSVTQGSPDQRGQLGEEERESMPSGGGSHANTLRLEDRPWKNPGSLNWSQGASGGGGQRGGRERGTAR